MHLENGTERPRICAFCMRNQHRNCVGHNFDPHEPDIHDCCECVCEQRIGRQYDKMIDLVADLDKQLEESRRALRNQTMLASRAAQLADNAVEVIRKFDHASRDDEGNFMVPTRAGHIDQHINALLGRIRNIADEGEAVIKAIVGDISPEELVAKKILAISTDEDDLQRHEAEENFLAATYNRRKELSADPLIMKRRTFHADDEIDSSGWPVG